MSGYPALRSPDNDFSNSTVYGAFGQDGAESDTPIVLARVADFTAEETDQPSDEPVDTSFDDFDEEFPEERSAFAFDFCSAGRSRLAVGGLVLVAGLFGFFIGRITSPTAKNPDQWRPAPTAAEAPGWDSETVATSEVSPMKQETLVQRKTPEMSQWDMSSDNLQPQAKSPSAPALEQTARSPKTVTAERPNWQEAPPQTESYGQSSPWPRQSNAPASVEPQSRWAANQNMALPARQVETQPSQRPMEYAPYTDARLARRPTTSNQTNTPSGANVPTQVSKQYPAGQHWVPEKAAVPCHGGPTGYSAGPVNQNGNGSTGYPQQQNTTNNAPANVPAQRATGQNGYPNNYPYYN